MNGDVTIKTKDGIIARIPYTTIKKVKLPGKPEESTKQITVTKEKPAEASNPSTRSSAQDAHKHGPARR